MLYLFKPIVWVIDVAKIFKRTQGSQDALLKNIIGFHIEVSSTVYSNYFPWLCSQLPRIAWNTIHYKTINTIQTLNNKNRMPQVREQSEITHAGLQKFRAKTKVVIRGGENNAGKIIWVNCFGLGASFRVNISLRNPCGEHPC